MEFGNGKLPDPVVPAGGEKKAQTAVVDFEPPDRVKGILMAGFAGEIADGAAEIGDAVLFDGLDQVVVGADVGVDFRIGHAHIFFFMGIRAAGAGLAVACCHQTGDPVGLGRFAGVEALHEIELVEDPRIAADFFIEHGTGTLGAKGRGRTQNAAHMMDHVDQLFHRHAANPEKIQLHAVRHDHEEVAGIFRIVFDTFQHHEIAGLQGRNGIPPLSVAAIGIVIGDQHAVESLLLQKLYVTFQGHAGVDGTGFCMTM